MSWFKRQEKPAAEAGKAESAERRVKTEGLWQKCEGCRQIIWKKDLEGTWNVCPKCGAHGRIDAATRLKMLLDADYEQYDTGLRSSDPLGFVDSKPYKDRLAGMEQATGLADALIS